MEAKEPRGPPSQGSPPPQGSPGARELVSALEMRVRACSPEAAFWGELGCSGEARRVWPWLRSVVPLPFHPALLAGHPAVTDPEQGRPAGAFLAGAAGECLWARVTGRAPHAVTLLLSDRKSTRLNSSH